MLARFGGQNRWYLPVTAEFELAEGAALFGRLRRSLRNQSVPEREIDLDARLLDILACPVCKGPLRYERKQEHAHLPCRPPGISDSRRHTRDARG